MSLYNYIINILLMHPLVCLCTAKVAVVVARLFWQDLTLDIHQVLKNQEIWFGLEHNTSDNIHFITAMMLLLFKILSWTDVAN